MSITLPHNETRSAKTIRYHGYAPRDGHGLKHSPLLAIVGPRPIGWISTVSKEGRPNLAPYSFFNMLRPDPPLLAFASGGQKDSLQNAQETGKFVWNLVTRPLANAMNISSASVARDVDEFELSGLTCGPSSYGMPGYVVESPVSFDCIVTDIINLKDLHGAPSGSSLVIGEVVYVRIADHLIHDGVYDTLAGQPVLRGGGLGDYFEVLQEGHFFLKRPEDNQQ